MAVAGETRRLAFYVAPLSGKGLLSQQVRDALKALESQTHGDPVLHLRAFVAGTGDFRRVRDLVSETFTARRQPLPSLSLVRAGGLPLAGAQVALEAVAARPEGRESERPRVRLRARGGISRSRRPGGAADGQSPRFPDSGRKAAGAEPPDVVRVTCFFSSLEDLAASRALVEAEYPRAVFDYVQSRRAPAGAMSACEALARPRQSPGARLKIVDSEDSPAQPGESLAVLLDAPRVVLTGTQASFGYEEKDARLAFERLRAALVQAGASPGGVAFARYYPLSSGIAAQVRKIRLEFFDAARPPAASLVVFEGLPSMDAGFAVDVVAAGN